MSAYYNENDKFAAEWLRELIKRRLIADGEVDTRSIADVRPADIAGFTQCHFFAGIGGWSLALRLAGWPDHRPVWTGSCPCQPFSSAGKGDGFADERHLWPAWFWLIGQHRPRVIFGEQVESPAARAWLDLVFTDLEAVAYASAAVDLPAAGIGAPHIRQRLVWLADCEDSNRWSEQRESEQRRRRSGSSGSSEVHRMADDNDTKRRSDIARGEDSGRSEGSSDAERRGGVLGMADKPSGGQRITGSAQGQSRLVDKRGPVERMGHGDSAGRALVGSAELPDNGNTSQRHDVDGRSADGRLVHGLITRLEGHGGDGGHSYESRRLNADAARSIAATGATGGAWGGGRLALLHGRKVPAS